MDTLSSQIQSFTTRCNLVFLFRTTHRNVPRPASAIIECIQYSLLQRRLQLTSVSECIRGSCCRWYNSNWTLSFSSSAVAPYSSRAADGPCSAVIVLRHDLISFHRPFHSLLNHYPTFGRLLVAGRNDNPGS